MFLVTPLNCSLRKLQLLNSCIMLLYVPNYAILFSHAFHVISSLSKLGFLADLVNMKLVSVGWCKDQYSLNYFVIFLVCLFYTCTSYRYSDYPFENFLFPRSLRKLSVGHTCNRDFRFVY